MIYEYLDSEKVGKGDSKLPVGWIKVTTFLPSEWIGDNYGYKVLSLLRSIVYLVLSRILDISPFLKSPIKNLQFATVAPCSAASSMTRSMTFFRPFVFSQSPSNYEFSNYMCQTRPLPHLDTLVKFSRGPVHELSIVLHPLYVRDSHKHVLGPWCS